MKLPMKWLADYVDLGDVEIKRYCDRMTETGSKVEGLQTLGEDIDGVVTGRILSVEKHPDADRLAVCSVDTGGDAPIQIVTAAKNIFSGACIPVATDGAHLPGGVKIKAGKLRGVLSEGMMCSIAELSLTLHDMPGAAEDGILILDENTAPGQDIKDVLMLADDVVEFEITPNRPDCLSVIGLARETAASFGLEMKKHTPAVRGAGDSIDEYISVRIDEPELCPRYTAKVVKNVSIAPSPLWMRSRLRAAGVRPINNIVDITNYVMLEYGQPMHAFDYKCLDGRQIIVRRAAQNEVFRTLDGGERVLNPSMLVIADAKKPVALAGIMGGENSEITEQTKTVVFESANFYGAGVRQTSRALGMRTESSGRFEKGLDPEITEDAVLRACELVEMLGAGEVADGMTDCRSVSRPQTVLTLDAGRINEFLGTDISEEFMRGALTSLDFRVEGDKIYVPSHRGDVECMNDIAEEIIRIYGYNKIGATRFRSTVAEGKLTAHQAYLRRLNGILCGMGLNEIQTFSFISPKYYDKINLPGDSSLRESVTISNPLGEDTSVMRTTAVPSMAEVLARNANYRNENCALYEVAKVYLPRTGVVTNTKGIEGSLPKELIKIVIGLSDGGFYRLKGMCEAIFAACGTGRVKFTAEADNPTYHPGRCAVMSKDGERIGVLGQLHPVVLANYSMSGEVCVADIDFESLFALSKTEKQYKPLPRFPAVTRDFSFVCDCDIEAAQIEEIMEKTLGKLLDSYKLFDVYTGAQLVGKKSVSYCVGLRAPDRTLTAEETEHATEKMLKTLSEKLGVTLRK